MEIIINLYKSEIIHEVMNDTYLHGKSRTDLDKEKVYNIQAADEDSHTSKLLRSMQTGIEEVKSVLSSILKESSVTANNIEQALGGDNDTVTLTLNVSSRFNKAYTSALASASHKYIVNKMLFDWYSTVNPDSAKMYFDLTGTNLNQIKSCFVKLPPKRPLH